MTEDNSLDVFGVKPLSKAVEKATDKSIDGLGSFFAALCMPAAEEFGLLLRDKVTAFRRKNLEAIAAKTKQKIEGQKALITGTASPMLLREVIEEASWSEDDRIQSMWAGLLATASGQRALADDSLVYTDTLKRITPFQARFLNCVYRDPRCCSVKAPIGSNGKPAFYPENELTYSIPNILKIYPGDLSEIVPIANVSHKEIVENSQHHSIAISRFRPQIESIATQGLVYAVQFPSEENNGVLVIPSYKGLDFYMRCLGYSVYPLEAFILTLQHWASLEGIDPFTHSQT